MKLDNENQRAMLLEIIASVNFRGNINEIKESVRLIDELTKAVNEATIEEQE